MAVDDAGRWRMQGRHTLQLRFQHACLLRAQPLQVVHAIGLGLGGDAAVQRLQLGLRGGHNEFARTPMGNAALGAVAYNRLRPPHAQPGFARIRG